MLSRSSFVFVFSLLLIQPGCTSEQPQAAPKAKAPSAARVAVDVIERDELEVSRRFLGEVRSVASSELAAGAAGEVLRVNVSEGDEVERGKLLVSLDDALVRARVRELEASLSRNDSVSKQAVRDLERVEGLTERGHFPGAERDRLATRRDELEAERAGLLAQLRRLREELSLHQIRAPFEGSITRRYVNPGEWVQPGQTVLGMTSVAGLEILVRVPEPVVEALDTATAVDLYSRGRQAPARFAGIVGALNPETRTALLRVIPDEAPAWLREGSTVDVELRWQRQGEGVVVHADSLVFGAAGVRVFTVKDGEAHPVDVTVIARSGDEVLVHADGLTLADRVVRRGNERLRPGQKVREE